MSIYWIGLANVCTNKTVVVRTQFESNIRSSNAQQLCYNVDRGEILNVPTLEQTIEEVDGIVSYSISLSPAVVPTKEVRIKIQSKAYDYLNNQLDMREGYRCLTSTTVIIVTGTNHDISQSVLVTPEDNKVDGGTLETMAYKCRVFHSIESLDKQYVSKCYSSLIS